MKIGLLVTAIAIHLTAEVIAQHTLMYSSRRKIEALGQSFKIRALYVQESQVISLHEASPHPRERLVSWASN